MEKRTILTQVSFVSAALALALVTSDSALAAPREVPPGAFCKPDAIVRNYLGSITKLQGSRGFPKSGRLSVGPKALRVYPPRERLVVVGRDQFESQGALSHPPPRPPVPLGWWVSSRLERIGKRGVVSGATTPKRQYIATVNGFRFGNFGFGSNVKPGTYRLDVSFEDRSGRLLREYQEYFRAVKAHSSLKLSANRPTFEPGGAGYLRVENYGTVPATFLHQYRIWRLGDGSGELQLPPQVYSGVRPLVGAGRAGGCIQFSVPADAPAGEYQVGVEAKDSLMSRWTVLLTRFEVEVTRIAPQGYPNSGICDSSDCPRDPPPNGTHRAAVVVSSHPWHLRRMLGLRTIKVAIGWTSCGRSAPTIHADVVERPGRAVITTLARSQPLPPGTACLKMRGIAYKQIRLGAPVADLKLFDGSYAPPRLRSPDH